MIYSPLTYPGSKRRVMQDLLTLFPDNIKDWREPFMGSLSVTLAFIQSKKADKCSKFTVGDLNKELWYFWKGIQDYPDDIDELQREWFTKYTPTLHQINNYEEGTDDYKRIMEQIYKESRDLWESVFNADCESLDPKKRATRWYICNRLSFSGLTDSSGSMSPSRVFKYKIDKLKDFKDLSKLIQNIEFLNVPFNEIMKDETPETFIFLDPPYYAQEKTGLYGRMGDIHKGFPHKEFCQLTNKLKCKWMVTYDDSPFTRRMFRNQYIKLLKLNYSCANGFKEDMLDGEEIIVTNYSLEEEQTTDI